MGLAPGDRLAEVLELAGITQVEAASRLGITQGALSNIIRGRQGMTPTFAAKAAEAFDCRAGWLLFGEGEAPASASAAVEAGRRQALLAVAQFVASQLAASTVEPPFDGLEPVTGAEAQAILDAVDGLHGVPPEEGENGRREDPEEPPEDRAAG